MAKKSETKFREIILKELKKLPYVDVTVIQAGSIRGIPDLLICVRGYFVAVELKMNMRQARRSPHHKLQLYKLKNIRKAKGHAFVCDPERWPSVYQLIADIATKGEPHDYTEIRRSADAKLRKCLESLKPSKRARRACSISDRQDGEEG